MRASTVRSQLCAIKVFVISGQLFDVTQETMKDRDAMYQKYSDAQKELAEMNQRYGALNEKYEASHDSVHRLEKRSKGREEEISARLEKAKRRSEELERTIEKLKGIISELEQQCSASMDKIMSRWQISDEEKEAILELSHPTIKSGYHMALRYHLPEVPP